MPPHAPGQGRRYGHRLAVLAVAALALVGLNVSAAHAAPSYSRGVQASAPAALPATATNIKSCVAYIGTGYVRATARGPGGWRPNGGSWEWTAPDVRTATGWVFVGVHSTTNPYQFDSCGFPVQ